MTSPNRESWQARLTGRGRAGEAGGAAAAGAMLGGLAGATVGAAIPAALAAAANGAISGWRGVYDWRAVRGVGAFVLDSTWALGTTVAGLASHAVGAVRGQAGYVPELSERQDRHVYRRGFQPRRNFAVTLGNVVSGAGDVTNQRRVRLVTDHEDVHVWQARALGPAYPLLYVGWMALGAVVGAARWTTRHRAEPFNKVVETYAYYLNPFEWWAYSRDGHWPPNRLAAELGYRRPAAKAFATSRRSNCVGPAFWSGFGRPGSAET